MVLKKLFWVCQYAAEVVENEEAGDEVAIAETAPLVPKRTPSNEPIVIAVVEAYGNCEAVEEVAMKLEAVSLPAMKACLRLRKS